MRQRRRFRILPAALAIMAAAISFGPADLNAAQPKGVMGFIEVSGTKVISPRSGVEQGPFRLRLQFVYSEHDVENIPFGGLVGFGAFDSGEVLLLEHIKYMPNLSDALSFRNIYPPGQLLEPSQTPRFVMLCALPIKEPGQNHGPVIYAYSERSDPNFRIDKTRDELWHFSARWQPVPAKRAQSKFADRDYCGEFLKANKSPVPLWLPDSEYQ